MPIITVFELICCGTLDIFKYSVIDNTYKSQYNQIKLIKFKWNVDNEKLKCLDLWDWFLLILRSILKNIRAIFALTLYKLIVNANIKMAVDL